MQTLKNRLGLILVIQLLIVVGLYSMNSVDEGTGERRSLLPEDSGLIDVLEISDAEGLKLRIERKGDLWTLPEAENLPVNSAFIEGKMSQLRAIETGWPVATTSGSQDRFEVSEEKFQRKLSLYHGEELKEELYLGTSPGFRKLHLRRGGEEAIHALKLNLYDYEARAKAWFDKKLIAATQIKSLKGSDYALEMKDGEWELTSTTDSALELNREKVDNLVRQLNNLQVSDYLQSSGNDPKMTLKVGFGEGEILEYKFYENNEEYWVSRNDYPLTFKIFKNDFENITQASFKSLTTSTEAESDSEKTPK